MNIDQVVLAEKAIVGRMVDDHSVFDHFASAIAIHVFIDPFCNSVWKVASEIRKAGGSPTQRAILKYAMANGISDIDARGLGLLSNESGTKHNDEYYLSFIMRHDARQRALQAFNEATVALDDDWFEIDKILNRVANRVSSAMPTVSTSQKISDLMIKAANDSRLPSTTSYLESGFEKFDRQMGGGFGCGDLSIIAARPSAGKTTFATQVGLNIAKKCGGVLIISLEMPSIDVVRRVLSSETGIDFNRMKSGSATTDQFQALVQVSSNYRDVNLFISDVRSQTVESIAMQVRSHIARHEIKAVIIDYIGLVNPSDRFAKRYESIGHVSRELKGLAVSESIAVIALSQLNRDVERTQQPSLKNLRDSGSIEQDADVVIFIYENTEGECERTVEIAKNRNGELGATQMVFDGSRYRFSEPIAVGTSWDGGSYA